MISTPYTHKRYRASEGTMVFLLFLSSVVVFLMCLYSWWHVDSLPTSFEAVTIFLGLVSFVLMVYVGSYLIAMMISSQWVAAFAALMSTMAIILILCARQDTKNNKL